MTRSEWSDEELSTIKKMWADGRTALEISKKLDGKSRKASLALPMENHVYEGDCLELLTRFEKHSVDLILCDLPYGTTQNRWDWSRLHNRETELWPRPQPFHPRRQ